MAIIVAVILVVGTILGNPAGAQPLADSRDIALLDQARRAEAQRALQDEQRRLARARANCQANRGTDCDSAEGLREWLLLERSRAEAVLDRLLPPPAGSPEQ